MAGNAHGVHARRQQERGVATTDSPAGAEPGAAACDGDRAVWCAAVAPAAQVSCPGPRCVAAVLVAWVLSCPWVGLCHTLRRVANDTRSLPHGQHKGRGSIGYGSGGLGSDQVKHHGQQMHDAKGEVPSARPQTS